MFSKSPALGRSAAAICQTIAHAVVVLIEQFTQNFQEQACRADVSFGAFHAVDKHVGCWQGQSVERLALANRNPFSHDLLKKLGL